MPGETNSMRQDARLSPAQWAAIAAAALIVAALIAAVAAWQYRMSYVPPGPSVSQNTLNAYRAIPVNPAPAAWPAAPAGALSAYQSIPVNRSSAGPSVAADVLQSYAAIPVHRNPSSTP